MSTRASLLFDEFKFRHYVYCEIRFDGKHATFFRLDFGRPEVCIDIERKMILNKQISWEEKSNSYIKHNVAFSLVSEENRHNLEILLYRATYYRLPRSILSEAQKMYWYFLYHLFSQTKINPFFSFRETKK